MANKTIYVRDEQLWERARELAGRDGLSAVISDALTEFVARREAEKKGFSLYHLEINGPYSSETEEVRFWGKRLGDRLFGRGPDLGEGVAEVYQTKAGKLVLVLRDAVTLEAHEYRTFDTPEELARDGEFGQIPVEAREDFADAIAAAIGHRWATWID